MNAERVANGLPGGIVEDPDWSRGCVLHNAYLRLNSVFGHDEDPQLPGYTPEGRTAGMSSVLAYASGPASVPWSPGLSAFRTAPIHLMQLLAPRLSVTGVDDSTSDGRSNLCIWTWPGYLRATPAGNLLYSFPGDGQVVRDSETARESPFVPGDFVGLPQGTQTGPHLYLLADGPWASRTMSVVDASLIGPAGAVTLRWVTSSTPEIGPYLPPGAILVPTAPLQPGAYRATATLLSGSGAQVTRSWGFTVPRRPNRVAITQASAAAGPFTWGVSSTAPDPKVVLTGPDGGSRTLTIQVRWAGAWTTEAVSLGAGVWRTCASSGGGNGPYEASEACASLTLKDTDRDGLLDGADACPQDPGPAALSGCPDTDGDTVADRNDACPSVSGPAPYGCPRDALAPPTTVSPPQPASSLAPGPFRSPTPSPVISTPPLPGSGSSRAGPRKVCRVPRLAGLTLPAARTALVHANCRLGRVTRVGRATPRADRVLRSAPRKGVTLGAGSSVALVLRR